MPESQDLDYIIQITRDALADIQDEITGQISNTAQAIVDIWEIDCQGKWILYVKTGLVASAHALWLLLTPSLEEIIESYLQPKPGRRGGRRGQRGDRERRINRAGQRRLYFRPAIPDIDNAIADALPGRNLIAGRRIGPGEHLFWTGIDVGDRFLWYWLLIEATETFATVWQSELIKSGQCNALQDGACQFHAPPRGLSPTVDIWSNNNNLTNVYNQNLTIANNGVVELLLHNAHSSAMIIILASYTVERNSQEGTGTWEVGVKLTFEDFLNMIGGKKEVPRK